DGKPDIVIGYSSTIYGGGQSVGVLLGNGDGSFTATQAFPAATGIVAVADVNGDRKPDIVVADPGEDTTFFTQDEQNLPGVDVLLGNGDGTFQPPQFFASGSSPSAVAVADLNGDGRTDVVLANSGTGSVSVLLAGAGGSLSSSTPINAVSQRNTP